NPPVCVGFCRRLSRRAARIFGGSVGRLGGGKARAVRGALDYCTGCDERLRRVGHLPRGRIPQQHCLSGLMTANARRSAEARGGRITEEETARPQMKRDSR